MPIINSRYGIYIKDSKPVRVCQWIDCPDAEIGYDGRKMKMCAQCNVVRYCSKSCQRSDWSEHKLYCQIPPIMDIGQWTETYESLFRWALIEALGLRSEPSNVLHYGIFVKMTRMDRLMKGVAPSPFVINSLNVNRLDVMQKIMQENSWMVGDTFTEASRKILDAGGIGRGIVVFLVAGPPGGPTLFHFQYHDFREKPLGQESPSSGTGWENVVKGVVNGEIPISLISKRIGGPSNDASSEA
ncbi:hypothetical protein C8R45DRAFT_897311 [Mycena sanguinolenta]|nr:hypothetical protein C8R45DRAFT_897311 [Mycena sanguinolenta]